ncbi:hypothetical protein TCON_0298 [Astathelohania contejeani]|uniref:Uncharacterized protein n=1 Tax=Astathelohania contejeani TaxID=164912 RepID=A0ABQ7I227_9MICR|nr:hypothetical protein TCON_0298 [Thelohania contejeani]
MLIVFYLGLTFSLYAPALQIKLRFKDSELDPVTLKFGTIGEAASNFMGIEYILQEDENIDYATFHLGNNKLCVDEKDEKDVDVVWLDEKNEKGDCEWNISLPPYKDVVRIRSKTGYYFVVNPAGDLSIQKDPNFQSTDLYFTPIVTPSKEAYEICKIAVEKHNEAIKELGLAIEPIKEDKHKKSSKERLGEEKKSTKPNDEKKKKKRERYEDDSETTEEYVFDDGPPPRKVKHIKKKKETGKKKQKNKNEEQISEEELSSEKENSPKEDAPSNQKITKEKFRKRKRNEQEVPSKKKRKDEEDDSSLTTGNIIEDLQKILSKIEERKINK